MKKVILCNTIILIFKTYNTPGKQENTFEIRWDREMAQRVFNCQHAFSPANLKQNYLPPNLKTAFAMADQNILRE